MKEMDIGWGDLGILPALWLALLTCSAFRIECLKLFSLRSIIPDLGSDVK